MMNKKVIFICGERKKESTVVLSSLFGSFFRVLSVNGLPGFRHFFSALFASVVIIEDNGKDSPQKIRSFLKKYRSPALVFTGAGGHLRKRNILLNFPKEGSIIVDYTLSRKIKKKKVKEVITFGNRKNADIHITDINKGEYTNFKVSYRGSFTPFWIKGRLKNKEIYAVICALSVMMLFSFNLVEISTKIREKDIFTER